MIFSLPSIFKKLYNFYVVTVKATARSRSGVLIPKNVTKSLEVATWKLKVKPLLGDFAFDEYIKFSLFVFPLQFIKSQARFDNDTISSICDTLGQNVAFKQWSNCAISELLCESYFPLSLSQLSVFSNKLDHFKAWDKPIFEWECWEKFPTGFFFIPLNVAL